MATRRKKEEQTPDRLIELIDEQVKARHEATLAERKATQRITELASEARGKGLTASAVAEHVKRVDKDGKLVAISRQALDVMLAPHEGRREPRTTRASRRRREPEAAGQLNSEVFG